MARLLLIIGGTLIIVGTASFLYENGFLDISSDGITLNSEGFSDLPSINQTIRNLEDRRNEIVDSASDQESMPPPIRLSQPGGAADLSGQEVLVHTNAQRLGAGLPPLGNNERLNRAAYQKMQDLFERQYFEHVSPTGEGAGDLAEQAGYEFISIGENLALGNFASEAALVQAWMDSPGHRANILHTGFEEIGIAVGKGEFEGSSVWIGVQIFGVPVSACPAINQSLKTQIQQLQQQTDALQEELARRKADIEDTWPKAGPIYNRKVEEYNALVEQYNALVQQSKQLVQQYNSQVEVFNACVADKSRK